MQALSEVQTILSHAKPELTQKYPIKSLGIFGSYVRGTANETSDLDILVQFDKPIGLDFVVLAEELETLLKIKVDLVSRNAISSRMWPYVKENLVYV